MHLGSDQYTTWHVWRSYKLLKWEWFAVCSVFCVLRGVGNCTLTFWYSSPNNCCYNNHTPFNSMGEWKLQFYILLLILCMSWFRAIYRWRACCLLVVAFKRSVAFWLYLMAYDAGCRLTRLSHRPMCILASAKVSCFTPLPMMRGGSEHCCFPSDGEWWPYPKFWTGMEWGFLL